MFFGKALPVFPKGRERERNLTVGFYAFLPAREEATLVITGASLYSVFVNGEFVLSGPARTCPGKHRVTELPLGQYLNGKPSVLSILLYSYCTPSFSYPEDPGFLEAEVVSGGEVLAYTDADGQGGFTGVIYPGKRQKTPRYSFQRSYSEVYRLTESESDFPAHPDKAGLTPFPLAVQEEKILIPQDLYLPTYPFVPVRRLLESGSVEYGEADHSYRVREHFPTQTFTCYPLEECECLPFDEVRGMKLIPKEQGGEPLCLGQSSYALLDFGREYTGLITMKADVPVGVTMYLVFDEVLRDGKVDATRLAVCNIVKYRLYPGEHLLLTAEPYSFRYLTVIVTEGSLDAYDIGIRRVGFREITKKLDSSDPDEQEIYDAAVETFRQNTYDIFMDCPSRERAGWLCDSFFTARVEYELTGKSVVERAFLDNYLLADSFPDIPEGMLPMCYPSDHRDHVYIPNWAMWYVLELGEYAAKRNGDPDLIARAKDRVLALISFFDRFLNGDGLLENLDSWVFVEWSKANELTRDVNFPTNALYAAMLDTAASLYGLPNLARRAEKIRAYLRKNTLVGGFFCDNAVRGEDGELRLSGLCTEVCQYYMFYFGVASPETHPDLWRILSEEFGPDRAAKGLYPEIFPANSFIGNYLRLDLLYRYGLYDRLLAESKGYFLYMAQRTGTLWENTGDYASCNHGFASHAALWLLKIRGEKK